MKKNKILLIDPLGFEGPGNYDYLLCSELRKLNVDIDVVSVENFPIRNKDCTFKVYRYFTNKFRRKNKIQKGVLYIASLFKVFIIILFKNYKTLHIQFFLFAPVDLLFLRICKILFRVKIIYTANDVIPLVGQKTMSNSLRFIYCICDFIIVHSNYAKKTLSSLIPNIESKIQVVHHGNYISFCKIIPKRIAKEKLGIAQSKYVLLFYGSVRENKGLEFLLEAIEQIARCYENIVLIVAGLPLQIDFYRLYGDLINKIKSYLILDLNFIPADREALYFNAADIVYIPYTEVYTSGVLILAGSYKKCSIVSEVGGLPELLIDGKTGFLVSPRNSKNIAEQTCEILSKGEDYVMSVGNNAFDYMVNCFSWVHSAQLTRIIYEEVYNERT